MIHGWARKAGRDPEGHHAELPRADGAGVRARQARGRGSRAVPRHRRRGLQDIGAYQALGVTDFIFDLTPPGSARAARHDGAVRRRRAPQGSLRAGASRRARVRARRALAKRRSSPGESMDALPAIGRRLHRRRPRRRLGTADASGQPLVVPICYAFDGESSSRRSTPSRRRQDLAGSSGSGIIRENPKVSVVIDRYDDDWTQLRYVIIQGRAELLTEGARLLAGRRSAPREVSSVPRHGAQPRLGAHDQGEAGTG